MMRRTGAVSAFLLSLSCAACASYPGFGRLRLFRRLLLMRRPLTRRRWGTFLVARYAAMTNDPREAARRYAASIDTAPESTGIAERAVYSALVSGDYPQAVQLANKAHGVRQFRHAGQADARHRGNVRRQGCRSRLPTWRKTGSVRLTGLWHAAYLAWRMLDADGPEAAETYLRDTLTGDPRLDSATLYMMGLIQLSAHSDADALAYV
jgi:hypothetical protein